MNKEFVGQFIMTSYALIEKTDLITASLYGYIWSKCQLYNGYCSVSYINIAKELKTSRRTVIRRIQVLLDLKLIKDENKNKRNFPGVTRHYVVNEVEMTKLINAYSSARESLPKDNLDDSSANLSTSSATLSTSSDRESQSSATESHEVDIELNKKEIKNISQDLDLASNEQKIEKEFTDEELIQIEARSVVPF